MITNAIARRYAKALVQLSADERLVEKVHGELVRFEAVLAGEGALRSVLINPAYGIEEKRAILKDIIARLALSGMVVNFLMLLLDRGRIGYLSSIVAAYGAYADEISGVVRPVLYSAMPLEESEVKGIKEVLTRSTGKKVIVSLQVDPSLIGGVVTKIGDTVYDGSIRTQLNRIEGILQKG